MLKKNIYLVAGTSFAKVKNIFNESGRSVPTATPSTAVEVTGWKTQPHAGEVVTQVESEVRDSGYRKIISTMNFKQKLFEMFRKKLKNLFVNENLNWQLKNS